MFGRRGDGYLVKHIDPIVALTPYLMPMRCDAQVMLGYEIEYEPLARYIVKMRSEGYRLTFMDVFFASYVRTIAGLPELNRFIANKRIYARKELAVSFVLLKDTRDASVEENTVKCKFDPYDTIFDVSSRLSEAITANRREDADNAAMKLAKLLLNPVLASVVAGSARFLDYIGLLPKAIREASPFHTSLFFTNMASIGMPAVNHHIYNFGTTSLFLSLGSIKRVVDFDAEGKPVRKRVLPVGVVADERVCAGMIYSKMVASMLRYLKNPELLEEKPEVVLFDEGHVYGLPPAPRKRHLPRFRKKAREGNAAFSDGQSSLRRKRTKRLS